MSAIDKPSDARTAYAALGCEPGRAAAHAAGMGRGAVLIGIRQIRELFGLGRSSAYALTLRPDFPATVRISPRCNRWWSDEVERFAIQLREHGAAERERARAAPRAGQAAAPKGASPPRITGRIRPARRRRAAP